MTVDQPITGTVSTSDTDRAPGPRPWTEVVADHPAWRLVPELAPQRDEVVRVVAGWADRYALARAATAADPWWDDELAVRVSGHGGRILHEVLGDPGPESAGGRTHDTGVEDPGTGLSRQDVLVLLLFPFAHQTYWATVAAEAAELVEPVAGAATGHGGLRVDFERFVGGYPRLARRTAQLLADPAATADAGRAIRWWTLHRWLARDPARYDADRVAEVLAGAGPASDGSASGGAASAGPATAGGTAADPAPPVPVPALATLLRSLHQGGTGPVGGAGAPVQLLLRLAHRMALEPISLPDVVVDHVGIADPVLPAELLATIRSAGWRRRGRTLILQAGCAHQAVDAALGEHVAAVGSVLAGLDAVAGAPVAPNGSAAAGARGAGGTPADVVPGPAAVPEGAPGDAVPEGAPGDAVPEGAPGDAVPEGAPGDTVPGAAPAGRALAEGFARLPVHASAEDVGALAGPDGVRAYTGHGFRFRLADDRVQELLMGEQLYGDRALAVRELYQNALDACRYRAARTTYLRRTGSRTPEWSGRIFFTADTDEDGRPYLDCVDNGIGMGPRELVDVFSNAGVRFADLPEFIQEQAEWARHGIHLHPNSRFGIGVLSYFMLADEITVTTCRADSSGHPGHLLRVSIAGPGTLARIQDLGPGTDAGTTIRLHLRAGDPSTSAVDLLRRLLWISPFEVSAADDTGVVTWAAGRLSEVAPVGHGDPTDASAHGGAQVVLPTADSNVYWTNGGGAVLADGLWVGTTLFGAVVNLAGAVAPQLTVDRRSLVRHDPAVVRRMLTAQVPALADAGPAVFDSDWLLSLAKADADLADEVGVQMMARHHRWGAPPRGADLAEVGCFPLDELLFLRASGESNTISRDLPETVGGWRLRVWARTGALPGVACTDDRPEPVAGPSDQLLLSRDLDGVGPWLDPSRKVRPGQVVYAALRTGRAPKVIADRLAELGLRVPQREWPATVEESDLLLLSVDLDGKPGWLPGDKPVRPGHVMAAAHRLGRSPAAVAQRLRELGMRVPAWDWPATAARPDLAVLSRLFTGEGPWLRPGEQARDTHVLLSALGTARSVPETIRFLARFGLSAAERVWPTDLAAPDLVLLSVDLDGKPQWLSEATAPRGHVLAAAHELGIPPTRAAARLAQLGVSVPDGPWPDRVEASDLVLLSRDGDGKRPWHEDGKPVPPGRVLSAVAGEGRSPAQVVVRLAELGLPAVVNTWPGTVDDADLVLLSRDRDRQGPWLRAGKRVPAGHEEAAARKCDRTQEWIRERLLAYGLRPSRRKRLLKGRDRMLLSHDLDGKRPYYSGKRIPFGHVLAVAVELGWSPQQVAERAARFGLRTDLVEGMALPERARSEDIRLLSRDIDGCKPWLRPKHPVADVHVLRAAARTRRTAAEVAARIAGFGFTVSEREWPAESYRSDLVLLSRDLDAIAPWIDAVTAGHLLSVAVKQKMALGEVVARVVSLGLALPSGIAPG